MRAANAASNDLVSGALKAARSGDLMNVWLGYCDALGDYSFRQIFTVVTIPKNQGGPKRGQPGQTVAAPHARDAFGCYVGALFIRTLIKPLIDCTKAQLLIRKSFVSLSPCLMHRRRSLNGLGQTQLFAFSVSHPASVVDCHRHRPHRTPSHPVSKS